MKLRLLHPRGMCAGVDRAIRTVELARKQSGDRPVYVRKQIVHNQHVLDRLRDEGVLFVEELDEVPDSAVVIFAAHGVSPAVRADAQSRSLQVIDATCPLVARVHRQVQRAVDDGAQVVLIGHSDHEEVIGTVGHAPAGAVTVISSPAEAEQLSLQPDRQAIVVTQTTLSPEDVREVVEVLQRRDLQIEHLPGICFATESRQAAVKAAASELDRLLVVGSANSSNTARLVETARRHDVKARRIGGADDLVAPLMTWLSDAAVVGITSGASTPEAVVDAIVDHLRATFAAEVIDDHDAATGPDEKPFALPREVSTKD